MITPNPELLREVVMLYRELEQSRPALRAIDVASALNAPHRTHDRGYPVSIEHILEALLAAVLSDENSRYALYDLSTHTVLRNGETFGQDERKELVYEASGYEDVLVVRIDL